MLADRLQMQGHRVAFEQVPIPFSSRRDHRILRAAERAVFGATCPLFDEVAASAAREPDGACDLAIVLAGALPPTPMLVQPVFDDIAGERALLDALLRGRAPLIAIRGRGASGQGGETGHVLAAGLPAIEDRHLLTRSLGHVLPRLITLIVQGVARMAEGASFSIPDLREASAAAAPQRRPFATVVARRAAEKMRKRLQRDRSIRTCRWRVAYRFAEGTGVAQERSWPRAAYRTLAHDGARFQADPFVVEHAGRRHIFFEDFPFETGRGVIARVEIDGSGAASQPTTVLEAPFHLSYPFVLAHGDHFYMLPEAGASGALQLYRAAQFPDTWVPDRVLLADTAVADATPVFHAGSWWMFATSLDDGGSSWDQLALFQAPDLLGPWRPHRANPVLVDAGAARPAGAMWHENGVLMRVAQDCRAGYGRGLAICRVDRLDADGFAQTVVARLGAPHGAFGVHTLSRAGALEAVDLEDTPDG